MTMTLEQLRNQLSAIEPDASIYEGIGASEILLLEQLLQDQEAWMASRVVFALSKVSDIRAVTVLSQAVADPRQEVRISVAASISNLRASDANNILVQLLEDPDIGVRKFAIRSVSETHNASVHAKLRDLGIQDPVPLMRAIAQDRMRELRLIDASATVLVTNLDQPHRATTIVPSDAGWAAQSFVTDDSDYWLESIEIIAGNLVGTPSIIAELRGGDATSLGDTSGTFTVPDLTTDDPQNVKLTPDNPIRLSPNTTYWLVLGTSGDCTFGWTYAEGNEQAGSGILGQYAYSEDQGVTWNTNNPDSNLYKLEVLVHPILTQ